MALAAHAGASAAVFIASWWVWRETGLPCTMETAEILLCNPDSGLSPWIRLDIIGQCGLNAGIALALTGGNDGMFFLQERRERKRETARADREAEARQKSEAAAQQKAQEAQATRQEAEATRQEAEATRQEAEATRQEAEATRQKVEVTRQEAEAAMRAWLQGLTEEQKDSIYKGTLIIGDVAWSRIGGQDIITRRTENGWLMDDLPDLPAGRQ